MLNMARAGRLPLPPERPDSEFYAEVRAPLCSVQLVQPVSDPECISNDVLEHHVALPVTQMMSQLVKEVQNEITDVDLTSGFRNQVSSLSSSPGSRDVSGLDESSLISAAKLHPGGSSLHQKISKWGAHVQSIREKPELSVDQFSNFLLFSHTMSQRSPDVFPTTDRCIRAVIEADNIMPGSAKYPQWIYDRFKDSVFKEDGNARSKISKHAWARGPEAFCTLKPVEGAVPRAYKAIRVVGEREEALSTNDAGSNPGGHLGVTWGVYLCAGKPPLADIILSCPPELTRCDSVIGLAIPATSGHIQYRGAASGDLYIRISRINRVLLS